MSRSNPPRTLGGILDASSAYLKRAGVSEPRLASEWLAARLLRCGRLELRSMLDQVLPEPLVDAMRRGMMRVAAGEPVQYVLGIWEFRGHTLRVDKRALIPRPETEQLVQLVLDSKNIWESPAPRIADYGTGSGCIAVSLAVERPQGIYLATDICEEALELARENAELNKVADRITFARGELADFLDPGVLDAIVSNPPYIPSREVDRLEQNVREHEPRKALDGGSDGLEVIRLLAEEATLALRNGGMLFLELSAEQQQGDTVSKYLREMGFDYVRIHRDHQGAERLLEATLADGV